MPTRGWISSWRSTRPDQAERSCANGAAWEFAQKVTHADLGHIEAYAAAQATVLLAGTLERLATEAEDDDEGLVAAGFGGALAPGS
jgi:hypothetical protein